MSCSANVNWAHGRLGYAESVMYRKELFENSIAEAQREMAKITDAEKADAAVLAEIARFDAAVATLRTKYAERERKEKYEELTRRVKARWNDANSNFPRFPDRVVTALGELRTSLEPIRQEFSDWAEAVEFVGEYDKNLVDFEIKQANHELSERWDKDIRSVRYEFGQAESNFPRFVDRVENACAAGLKSLQALEAHLDEYDKLTSLEKPAREIVNEWFDKFGEMQARVANAKCDVEIRDAINYPTTLLNSAIDSLKRYGNYNNMARNSLEQAIDARNKIKHKPEWVGHPKWEEFLQGFADKCAQFDEDSKRIAVEEFLKTNTSHALTLLTCAYTDLERQGLYNGIALGRFQDALDNKMSITGVEMVQGHPMYLEFLEKCRAIEEKFHKRYEEEELKDFLRNTCEGGALQILGFCDNYWLSSQARSMEYYHEAIDKAKEIAQHPRYGSHPKVLEFLSRFEEKRKAWKEKTDELVLKEAIRNATSDALMNLSHAKSYFDSGHQGQSMEYFAKAKEYALAVENDPRFTGRPELTEFFIKFSTTASAFEQHYRDTVLSKEIKDATSIALQNLDHAFNYLKSHESQALEYFAQANDKQSEIMSTSKFQGLPQLQEFVDRFETRASEFRQTYAAKVLADEVRSETQLAQQLLSNANSYFTSHHHGRALEYLEEAKLKALDIKFNTRINQVPEVQACLASLESGVADFEQRFKDTVLREQLRDELATASQALTNASIAFERSAADGLAELANAKQLGAAVSGNVAYRGMADAEAFARDFPGKVVALEETFKDRMLQSQVRDAIDSVKSAFHIATAFSDTAPEAQVLERLAETQIKRDQVAHNYALLQSPRGSEITAFLAEFDRQYADFKANYSAKIMAATVKEALERPRTALSHANTYFDSYRYDQSLEYLRQAYDEAGKLGADAVLGDLPQVVEFFEHFNRDAQAFKERYDARMREQAVTAAKDKVATNVSHAKSYFATHRRGQALEYLQQAKAHLSDYVLQYAEQPEDPWVAKIEAEIAAFEAEYVETVLRDELNAAKARCTEPLNRVQAAVDRHDIAQALRDLNESKDATRALGSDARFLSSPEVDAFLAQVAQQSRELQAAVDRWLDNERRKKRRESADTTFNNAKVYFEHHNRARAFEYLFEARGIIDDMQLDADDTDRAYIASWNARASEFEAACQRQLFDEELKALLQVPGHHMMTAEFYLKIASYEQASEALLLAKDAALLLAEPKYLAIPQVQQWFAEWVRQTDDFQTRFDNSLWQGEASRVRSTIDTHLHQAQIHFSQRSYDQALEAIARTTDAVAQLRDNEAVMRVNGMVEFADATDAKVRELTATFNATIFNDAIRQATSECESKLAQAQSLLERHAYARALEEYTAARELVKQLESEPRYNSQPVVQAFVARITADMHAFSLKYASSQLADEAQQHVSATRSELALAKTMLDRGAAPEAAKHLLDARQKAQPLLANEMLQQLESVTKVLADLKAAEADYATKQLSHLADSAIRSATPHLKQAAQYEQVHAKVKAIEALKEAESAAIDVLDDALYATLPSVADFQHSFNQQASRLKYSRKSAATATATSTSGSGDGDDAAAGGTTTVTGIVGGLIPYPDLRFKPIMISTDINPKIFNEIKRYNDVGGRINTEIRKAYRHVKDLRIDDRSQPLKSVCPLAHAHYPIKEIEKEEDELRRRVVREIADSAPDDPVGKEVREAIATFSAQWAETVARWRKASEIAKQIRFIDALFAWCDEGLAHYDEATKVRSSNTSSWHNNMMWAMEGHVPPESTDGEVCLQVIDMTLKIESLVASFESSFSAEIPGKSKLLARAEQLRKSAIAKHPFLPIHKVLTMAGNLKEHGDRFYLGVLRRFPKARASLMQQWEEHQAQRFERTPWDRESDGSTLVDPYAGLTISDAFDESAAEYHPAAAFDMIPPNDPSLAVRSAKSMKDSKLWTDLHKKLAGKIVFSSTNIDANTPVESKFASAFSAADEIYARAFWPHAISQLPLARAKADGSPVYGPKYLLANHKHYLELAVVLTVNGKVVERTAQPGGVFTWFADRGVSADSEEAYEKQLGQQTDFYAFNQTCRLFVSRRVVADISDDWENASNRFQRLLRNLGAGEHHVKLELVFRLVPGWATHDAFRKRFPPVSTPWSHPLATGELTVTATPEVPISLGNMLPARKTSVAPAKAAEYERLILQLLAGSRGWGKRANMTEHPFYVTLEGDWYCSGTRWFRRGNDVIEEPTEYSIACLALFYRSPATGWKHEEIAGFHLSAVTQSCEGCKPEPPFVHVAVGGNFTFDVDLLPDAVIDKLPRCPEHLRQGLFA